MSLSLGGRVEGVPVRDLVGAAKAFGVRATRSPSSPASPQCTKDGVRALYYRWRSIASRRAFPTSSRRCPGRFIQAECRLRRLRGHVQPPNTRTIHQRSRQSDQRRKSFVNQETILPTGADQIQPTKLTASSQPGNYPSNQGQIQANQKQTRSASSQIQEKSSRRNRRMEARVVVQALAVNIQ